jgi:hypothetical protein
MQDYLPRLGKRKDPFQIGRGLFVSVEIESCPGIHTAGSKKIVLALYKICQAGVKSLNPQHRSKLAN